MRLALVYRSFQLSASLARETVELARHLSERHDVHVFSISAQTDRSLVPACTFHDVPVWHVGDGRRFSGRELTSFARNAAAMLGQESYDAIHACAPSTWVADVLHVPGVAREEAQLQRIPSWRYAAQNVLRPGDAARRLLERKALTSPTLRRVHAATPAVRAALVMNYAIDPEGILVVPPAVNLDEFRPPEDNAAARSAAGIDDAQTSVLLFCGSAFERKGLDRAIVALAALRREAVLLVLGGGSQDRYRRLAGELGVSSRVRFLGLREDAWRFYQAADIVLLPTRADVWGVTPIEAMATGTPPIVTAAAGSATAVRDGETGIVLAEPFRPDALVDAIDRLLADRTLRVSMGEAGVEAAKAHSHAERSRRVEADLVAVAAERASGIEPRVRRRAASTAVA